MRSRIFSLLLLLALVWITLPAEATQTQPDTQGSCGENLTWTVADGVLTISGQGPMDDFSLGDTPWYDYNNRLTGDSPYSNYDGITAVVIQQGVTSIGDYAFRFCRGLESISIPEGVTSIGDYAFAQCTALKTIELPDSLITLGTGTFEACRSVETFSLPEGIIHIPQNAFRLCENMETIQLPGGVTRIEEGAFSQCSALKEITIPGQVTFLGNDAFGSCFNLKTVRFIGDAPETNGTPFGSVVNQYVDGTITTTAHYPAGDLSWTQQTREHFGGHTTWVAEGFTDVPIGAYYADTVEWAVRNGITTGTTPSTFSPDTACTRAQVVTFLWREAGQPEPTITENPFSDVTEDAYYYNAVLWATENGITTGIDAATFAPDASISRAQAVTFLWRCAGSVTAEGSDPFTDVSDTAYYAKAVLWAVEANVTTGTTASTFSPDAACTRGQIVTFLYRAMAE